VSLDPAFVRSERLPHPMTRTIRLLYRGTTGEAPEARVEHLWAE